MECGDTEMKKFISRDIACRDEKNITGSCTEIFKEQAARMNNGTAKQSNELGVSNWNLTDLELVISERNNPHEINYLLFEALDYTCPRYTSSCCILCKQ